MAMFMVKPWYKKSGGGGDDSWANATDARIAQLVAAADRGEIDLTEYWSVGDERVIHLDAITSASGMTGAQPAQNITLVLVAADTKTQDNTNPCYKYPYVSPVSGGRSYPSFIVQTKECLSNNVNITNTQNGKMGKDGWNAMPIRTWCNNNLKNGFPQILAQAFKQVLVTSGVYTNGGSVGATQQSDGDYFFLATEKEIQGSRSQSTSSEADQFPQWPYFATASNKIKYIGSSSTSTEWWNRSGYYPDANYICAVAKTGNSNSLRPWGNFKCAPCGCI